MVTEYRGGTRSYIKNGIVLLQHHWYPLKCFVMVSRDTRGIVDVRVIE